MNLDPKTLRFLALLSAPLFVWLKAKTGIDIPESTQDLLIATVITYIGGSHLKEAMVKSAEAKGAAAGASITTPAQAAEALADKPGAQP